MRTRHAGPRRMPTNAKKLLVQCLPHKRTSKHSAGYSLAAWTNVRPHQYDCKRIFLWSTDSRRIAFVCSPNICCISEWRWMLFAYMTTLCVLRVFSHSHTDVDAVLHILQSGGTKLAQHRPQMRVMGWRISCTCNSMYFWRVPANSFCANPSILASFCCTDIGVCSIEAYWTTLPTRFCFRPIECVGCPYGENSKSILDNLCK